MYGTSVWYVPGTLLRVKWIKQTPWFTKKSVRDIFIEKNLMILTEVLTYIQLSVYVVSIQFDEFLHMYASV